MGLHIPNDWKGVPILFSVRGKHRGYTALETKTNQHLTWTKGVEKCFQRYCTHDVHDGGDNTWKHINATKHDYWFSQLATTCTVRTPCLELSVVVSDNNCKFTAWGLRYSVLLLTNTFLWTGAELTPKPWQLLLLMMTCCLTLTFCFCWRSSRRAADNVW